MTEIYEAHPRLHHYTNFGGLKGILGSQTLWANHYKFLNDFSEVEHMRCLLEDMTYPIVNKIMRERAKKSTRAGIVFRKHGGIHKCSLHEARNIIDNFYLVTFKGVGSGSAFAEPFVVSFCAHTNHKDYEKNNGLLSMWRGYGDRGGFALVFDTKQLCNNLKAESATFNYTAFEFMDVIYDDEEEEKIQDEFSDIVQVIENFVIRFAEDESKAPAGDVFQPFFRAVTRFKHRGFREENEVRLVVAPASEDLIRKASEAELEGETYERLRPPKPIQSHKKSGWDEEVPHVVLNDVPKKRRLPITQIIVGPQRNTKKRMNEVKALAGSKINVTASETPYIPV